MREPDSSLRMILVSIQEGLGLVTQHAEVAGAACPRIKPRMLALRFKPRE
jgi:hypothetical protein